MLLPDMFDEKVALMGKEEGELSESRTTEKGTLVALSSGQMVTLFTTGPEGRTTVAPVEVILDDAKGTAGGKVSIAFFTPMASRRQTHLESASITNQLVLSYTLRGTRTTGVRS